VDLTPFAGLLNDGSAHKVAVRVFNANHNFATTATLLLYLDHGSSRVTGEVTNNTLSASPAANVVDNLSAPAADGTITGTVTTTASRQFTIAGEVKTSHGRVRTKVTQRIDFSNAQQFVSNPNSGSLVQDITQNTTISWVTERSGRQCCESCEVQVLVPPIACSRADSISDACKGNNARSARM
jgi:hypothetical protein